MTPSKRGSLFDMTAEVLRLGQEREWAEEQCDTAEVERIDAAIKLYLHENLPAKVDGIRGYVGSLENAVEVHSAEAEYHAAMAARAKGTIARIKSMCLEVMQHFQVKLYQGRLHTITRQGNGGLKPLEIRQPELVPDDLQMVTVKMSLDSWRKYSDHFADIGILCKCSQPEPDTAAIRSAIAMGEPVAGCVVNERGEHVRFS